MSLSGLYAGVLIGFLAAWAGYGYFFGISFLLSLPGMGLIFFIPLTENQQKRGATVVLPAAPLFVNNF